MVGVDGTEVEAVAFGTLLNDAEQQVDNIWGTSHPGWPQKGLIGNSRFNRKTQEKIRKYEDIHFKCYLAS